VQPSAPSPGLIADLQAAVADLRPAGCRSGLLRLALLLGLLAMGAWLYWGLVPWPWRLAGLLLVSLAETLLLIASHEAGHGTLLGQRRLERVLALLIGWPMAWPSGSYRLLHALHHRWNGCDSRDPEQVRLRSPGLLWRLCACGGLGLVIRAYSEAWRLRGVQPRLGSALLVDLLGVALLHVLILWIAMQQQLLLPYLLSWLVVERLAGAALQLRGAIEHWQLGQPCGHPLLTQLYGSRTVVVPVWMSWWLGGLPHHSVHHAFPTLPTDALPLATERVEAVLRRHGWPPLPRSNGYGEALALLGCGISSRLHP
jgi:fatty acid desaturase